jgi:ABC-type nitrate/sulfonate/bicarbonate transport system substrate-binding protein
VRSTVLRPFSLIAALVVLAAVVAACGSSGSSSSASSTSSSTPAGSTTPAKKETVRIALDYTANVNYLGIYTAIAKGFFAKQGIDPKIIPYANTPAEVLVKNGKTDLGISFPPDVLINRARGLKYKAVAGVVNDNTTALAVLADSPYRNPGQLSGKIYGGFGIPSDQPIVSAILKAGGASSPSFKQVVLNTDAYTALVKKRIDYTAVFGGIDDVTAELQQGAKFREFPYAKFLGAAGNYPNAVFVASDATIAKRGPALKRTLAALAQGYTYAVKHPAEAERLLIAQNPTALGKSQKIVTATGNATVKHFLDPHGQWGPLQNSDFSGLTKILVKGGVLKGTPPTPSEVYTNSLLPQG